MEQQYTVDGNLSHDNRDYKTGDPIVLNDQEAAPLLAIGRIKLPEVVPQAPADGFPAREEVKQPETPAAPVVPEAPVAPQQPAPAAAPDQAQVVPQAPTQPQTGQPSPEDIAKTVAGL